jgi:hypothetical protein
MPSGAVNDPTSEALKVNVGVSDAILRTPSTDRTARFSAILPGNGPLTDCVSESAPVQVDGTELISKTTDFGFPEHEVGGIFVLL